MPQNDDKYYVKHKDNGYGPFDTIEETENFCKEKMELPHGIAYIYYGKAKIIKDNESINRLHTSSELQFLKIFYLV